MHPDDLKLRGLFFDERAYFLKRAYRYNIESRIVESSPQCD